MTEQIHISGLGQPSGPEFQPNMETAVAPPAVVESGRDSKGSELYIKARHVAAALGAVTAFAAGFTGAAIHDGYSAPQDRIVFKTDQQLQAAGGEARGLVVGALLTDIAAGVASVTGGKKRSELLSEPASHFDQVAQGPAESAYQKSEVPASFTHSNSTK